MADDTTVIIDIQVENNTHTELTEITNNVVHLHQAVQQEERQESRWEKSLQRIRKGAATVARAVAGAVAKVSALAALTGPATSGLLAMGKALAAVGRAAVHLTPLTAFLPSLIGSLKLVQATVKLMAPGFVAAFRPFLDNFQNADGEASAFTKRLQGIAAIGLKPLVAEFNRVNLPAIQRGMEGIAYQLNGITNHTLRWLNTTQGQQLISSITTGTSKAMEALSPKVIRLVNAFGALASKAGDKAIAGLGKVIGDILDKISKWAETHDLDDINAALKDLAGYGIKIRQVFTAVRDVGRWLAENEEKIKHFSDVAAGAAIALGIATGNIPAIIGGSVSLIINHWDDLKKTFTGSGSWVSDLATRWRLDADRIKLADAIMKDLRAFQAAFSNVTKDIGPQWTAFVHSLRDAWQEWAPLITAWWNTGGKQVFQVAGAALGGFVLLLISAATTTAQVAKTIAEAFKFMVSAVLNALGLIITGAQKAFSWIPGMGPKLEAASRAFEDFKNDVNRALAGIDPIKTVRINASVYVTGGGSVAGGVDQRTGNSRNAGLSAPAGWQRVAAALAGARADTSRTGGPAQLTASVQNTVMLDGRPFRTYADRAVFESDQRTAWRNRNRRDR